MMRVTVSVSSAEVEAELAGYCELILPGYKKIEEDDGIIYLRRGRTAVSFARSEVVNAAVLDAMSAPLAAELEAKARREVTAEVTAEVKARTQAIVARKAWREVQKVPQYFRDCYALQLTSRSRFVRLCA